MKYRFLNPELVFGVIIALIVFAVGLYAFFVTIENIPIKKPTGGNTTGGPTTTLENRTYYSVINASTTGEQVFNIVGIIMIIGAIMAIIGVVYSYMHRRY